MNYLENYYNNYDEEGRLLSKHGQVEYITTQKYMALYEDRVKGIITPQRFVTMTEKLENEQKAARNRLQELYDALQTADDDNTDVRAFIEELKHQGPVQELNEVLLHRLIDKVIGGERQIVNGEKVQEVTIRYNFVGEIAK